jgi:hypothetical protein
VSNHARILTSVPRHPKFLRAGPTASWLWLCAVCYCQDALTDGFISTEAIHTLGVAKPLKLAAALVRERLWHAEENGWRIHDYLDHNNSAEYINKIRQERKAAGSKGGSAPRKPLLKAINQFDKQVAWDSLEQRPEQAAEPTFFGTTINDNGTTKSEELRMPDGSAASLADVRPRMVKHPQRLVALITALVTKDILPQRLEDHLLMDATRARCDELRIAHDDEALRRAIDSALFRYYRGMRLEFDLPPDPRRIYHDHLRPKRAQGVMRLGTGTCEGHATGNPGDELKTTQTVFTGLSPLFAPRTRVTG